MNKRMADMTKNLKDRLKKVVEEKRALAKVKDKLERIQQQNVIHLNVGGMKFTTTKRTLCSDPSSVCVQMCTCIVTTECCFLCLCFARSRFIKDDTII